MFHPQHFSRHPIREGPSPRAIVVLATATLLALVGLSPGTALAAADAHQPPQAVMAGGPEHLQRQAQVTPLLADWLDVVLNPLVSFLHGRQRLIQVGALIMVLALTIIWWRK